MVMDVRSRQAPRPRDIRGDLQRFAAQSGGRARVRKRRELRITRNRVLVWPRLTSRLRLRPRTRFTTRSCTLHRSRRRFTDFFAFRIV
jgi:hypothetical protein